MVLALKLPAATPPGQFAFIEQVQQLMASPGLALAPPLVQAWSLQFMAQSLVKHLASQATER